ncbi:hypothetical protein HK102_000598 [Quaeritorhiza haematococci]|nr:hypothetical protein HK102_000598 [Quaeritorhiza haematococci]
MTPATTQLQVLQLPATFQEEMSQQPQQQSKRVNVVKPVINTTLPHAPKQHSRPEQGPRLSRFICFLFQSIISRNSCAEGPLQSGQPAFLVMYIENVLEVTKCPLPMVMLALLYLDRVKKAKVDTTSIVSDDARLFAMALMLSQKYCDDNPYGNKMWSTVIGIPAMDLSMAEMQFLSALEFNLFVPTHEYAIFCKEVQKLARSWNRTLMEARLMSPIPMSPCSPAIATPMTPTASIPFIMNSIEEAVSRKRKTSDDGSEASPPETPSAPKSTALPQIRITNDLHRRRMSLDVSHSMHPYRRRTSVDISALMSQSSNNSRSPLNYLSHRSSHLVPPDQIPSWYARFALMDSISQSSTSSRPHPLQQQTRNTSMPSTPSCSPFSACSTASMESSGSSQPTTPMSLEPSPQTAFPPTIALDGDSITVKNTSPFCSPAVPTTPPEEDARYRHVRHVRTGSWPSLVPDPAIWAKRVKYNQSANATLPDQPSA